ncbi:MAG: hypothetical protein ACR2GR_01055 [Rhodothermales bacterium]
MAACLSTAAAGRPGWRGAIEGVLTSSSSSRTSVPAQTSGSRNPLPRPALVEDDPAYRRR